jgi:hypothetical protein
MGNSRVITHEEAVETVDRSKHAGFPDCYRRTNKGQCIDEDDKELRRFWDQLEEGTTSVWHMESLKKELRPHEKLDDNKLRTIIMMSIRHIIAHKRLTQDAVEKLHNAGFAKSRIALGFSPFYGGTQDLFVFLAGKGKWKGFEFDVSKMDSNVNQLVNAELCRLDWNNLRREDRTKENKQRMCRIRDHLMHAPCVYQDGNVFMFNEGNPSGQFLTAVDNSRFALFLQLYAWIRLTMKPTIFEEAYSSTLALRTWLEHTRAVCMGDDMTGTTDDPRYTGEAFAQVCFHEFGIILETPSEQDRLAKDLRFLSMGWKYDEEYNCVFHQLDGNNIVSSMLQGGLGVRDPATTLQRLTSLRLATWGDPEIRLMMEQVISDYIIAHDEKYGSGDPDTAWERAKATVQTDTDLEFIYTGRQATCVWRSAVALCG